MAKNNNTIFQNLTSFFGSNKTNTEKRVNNYNIVPDPEVIFKTNNKEEYEKQLLQAKQQKLLSYQWKRAGYDTAQSSLAGMTGLKLMMRDADLMDGFPEIGASLDILSEETTTINSKGKMLNIYSKSERIRSVLEDLFVNRLDIHMFLPMIARGVCKYGNNYQLLNIDKDNGIIGWRQLPVYEIERIESGIQNPYSLNVNPNIDKDVTPEETRFIWTGHNESLAYPFWQIAHFRLLTDSTFLPYGTSWLHKARRHWRMLSMMEDMMLVYRLERSVERRVFKIFVGGIDDEDVPAYVNEIANTMKRTPVVDPTTGQLDLRRNFMDMTSDYFIPVRSEGAPNPIETLSGAQNLTAMDDINYMENKVLSALRIPKTFLNFQDAQGKGQNLSIMDIRFTRTVNRVQQALLMELNKIAIIHLYLLGFVDDLTNFTLSMNNPSAQSELLEIENLSKRIGAAATAVADPGNGIPIYSWHRALKEIVGMSDADIAENLNEIRLEKALAAELEKTSQIIKRSGIFDPVDRIYGDIDAEYTEEAEGGMPGEGGAMPGGGGFGESFDNDMMGDIGEPGAEDGGDIGGETGTVDMGEAANVDNGQPSPAMEENLSGKTKKLITEIIAKKNAQKERIKKYNSYYENCAKKNPFFENYMRDVIGVGKDTSFERTEIASKTFLINEELNGIINNLNDMVSKDNDE